MRHEKRRAEDRMVEQIEEFGAELDHYPLPNGEQPDDRKVDGIWNEEDISLFGIYGM